LTGGNGGTRGETLRELAGEDARATAGRVAELDRKLATVQAALTKTVSLRSEASSFAKATEDKTARQADKLAGVGAKDRQALVLTGAIALPNGTRVCLRHIETYGHGGDEGVTISLRSGAVAHWAGVGAERKAAKAAFLAGLDRIFAVEAP